jgi:protein-disulfide isomerase
VTRALLITVLVVAVAPCGAQQPGLRDTESRVFYSGFIAAVRANDHDKLAELVAFPAKDWLVARKGNVETIGIMDALPVSGEKAGITLTAADRTLGSPKAPIMMLEYAAPTCPHCAHFNAEVFPRLKKKYIDTGKVYYVFRVFPLSPGDLAAEAMARCLPASSYMQFIDVLFRNQDKWDPEVGITDVHGGLVAMGRIVGMNAAQIDQCISNKAEVTRASQVGEDAQKRYAVEATPTFIINGQIHIGGFSWQDLQTLLDSLAKKGKKS